MRLSRRLAVAAATALGCLAGAQSPIPSIGARIHADYTTTNNFTLKNGQSEHLTGLELGVEFPITKLAMGLTLNAYPSVLMGGKLGLGGAEGNVYRFMLSAHEAIPGTAAYAYAGAGVSHTQSGPDPNSFDDVSGFQTVVGGSLPLTGFLGHFSPSLEAAYYAGDRPQFRGFSIGVSLGF